MPTANDALQALSDMMSRVRYGISPGEKAKKTIQGEVPGLPEIVSDLGAPGRMTREQADRYSSGYFFGKNWGPNAGTAVQAIADPFRRLLGDDPDMIQEGHRGVDRGIEDYEPRKMSPMQTLYSGRAGTRRSTPRAAPTPTAR